MEIRLTLALPRDELSIPVVRHVLGQAMRTLGVNPNCMEDIQLAISEACTDVLDHARADTEYEVSAAIDDHQCVIEICDRGAGFEAAPLGSPRPHPTPRRVAASTSCARWSTDCSSPPGPPSARSSGWRRR